MIERSDERDALVWALLPLVPERGWTGGALRAAAAAAGHDPSAAGWLLPRGPVEAIEVWADLADREMAEAADPAALAALRTPARIRRLVAVRLTQAAPHREALRRALGLLALPWNAPAAARVTARTVDAMWHAAGDRSADFSWYTRRATLAAVYGATLVRWLRDDGAGLGESLAFLDRRLADAARLGRLRGRGGAAKPAA